MQKSSFILASALGAALALFQPSAQAAAPATSKVGYIDLQRTLNETKVGKAAKDRLETDKKKKQTELDGKQEDLKKQAADLEKQAAVMKPEAVQQRQRDLQEKYVALQNTYLQYQQDLAKREAALTREIFDKASKIIDSIAKRDGYTVILEKNEGAVLFAEPSLDITSEVNKRLDGGEGQGASAPAKK